MKITYRHWSNLSNQELLDRYAECDVVSLVSVFEGFGMPIIEAQAVGRPVVTSSVSPMMEVAGPKACLVDPFDVGAIRAGVTKLLNDELYRDQVVAAGLKNVSRYKIEYAVRRYLQLYNLARGYSAELATEPMQ
jgi:glycosyltransferase involved in cell wall biosynthesis